MFLIWFDKNNFIIVIIFYLYKKLSLLYIFYTLIFIILKLHDYFFQKSTESLKRDYIVITVPVTLQRYKDLLVMPLSILVGQVFCSEINKDWVMVLTISRERNERHMRKRTLKMKLLFKNYARCFKCYRKVYCFKKSGNSLSEVFNFSFRYMLALTVRVIRQAFFFYF